MVFTLMVTITISIKIITTNIILIILIIMIFVTDPLRMMATGNFKQTSLLLGACRQEDENARI